MTTSPSPDPAFDADAPGSLRHAAHEAIVTIDSAQRIVMLNPAALRMFGCSAAEALGSDVARFIPARHRDAHRAHVDAFAASGESERAMGERLPVAGRRASGEEFPAAVTITRAESVSGFGPDVHFTALIRDLSVEQDLQRELDAVRQRFQAVFELSPNAVWITEGERIVFANRACAALFAAPSREALVGRSIYSLLHPQSRAAVRREVDAAFANADPLQLVHERIERLDGEFRDVEIALAPLPDHGRTLLQMVIGDITRRKQEAEAIERSRAQLRALSGRLVDAREDERRRIARELHDELGQHLTALKMELASLQPGTAQADARVAAMLEMLDETVAAVRRISADLRPLMLDDLGLNAAIEWLAREVARRLGIEVTVDLDEGDPPLSERAAIALYRMVQEALTNVARHARATEVRLEMHRSDGMLVLTVRDNGVGFPASATQPEGSFGLLGMRERASMLWDPLESTCRHASLSIL